ncbi:MAG: GIY-YIG nuclease family protein [Paludibacter sp.]
MLNKDKKLQDIFDNDPLGLLDVKPLAAVRSEDIVLVSKFQEIIDFYEQNQRLPLENNGVNEHTLYSRLCDYRDTDSKRKILDKYDQFGILMPIEIKVFTIDDIMNDDPLGLLDEDDMGLFDFNLVQRPEERASTDFVARRKPCTDFENYQSRFKEVQVDLKAGNRSIIEFKLGNLKEGAYYLHNGVLFYLEKINITKNDHYRTDGTRVRTDGRTRCIFENGTESNMLKRSVEKLLYANGNAITEKNETSIEQFDQNFSGITAEDKESGYIYILKSKSDKQEIKDIKHLYKIGFSTTTVEERIKHGAQEPTYLMAPVRIIMTYKCFNMNTHKLELLLHNFFGSNCLNVDVFDALGNRHTPREWFIAPLDIIEQAVHLIISGEIVKYRYNGEKEEIVGR